MLILGPSLGEKGDSPGHSTALYRAPAPDLTGPVGSVEHHTLTRFYALKTQNELQGLKSPWVLRRVWGMGLMGGREGAQTSTAGPASGTAQPSLPLPLFQQRCQRTTPTVTMAVRSCLPFRAVLVIPAISQRNGRVLRGKRDSSHQQQHRDASSRHHRLQDPWDSSQDALGQEAQGSGKL